MLLYRAPCRGEFLRLMSGSITRVVAAATKVGVFHPEKPAAEPAEGKAGAKPAVHPKVAVTPMAYLNRASSHRGRASRLDQSLPGPAFEALPLASRNRAREPSLPRFCALRLL